MSRAGNWASPNLVSPPSNAHNVTIEVLEQYVEALGAKLEVNVVKGRRKTRLLGANNEAVKSASGDTAGGVCREGLSPTAGSGDSFVGGVEHPYRASAVVLRGWRSWT